MEVAEDDFIHFVETCRKYPIDMVTINQLKPFGLSKEALTVVHLLIDAAYQLGKDQ